MRFLFVSTLYPSSSQPARASYSRSLMLALRSMGHDVRVIAPIPWCPGWQRTPIPPVEETLDGIPVSHPKFFYLPGLLTGWNHLHYRRGVRTSFQRTLEEFRPDHICVGFLFPDVAAMAPLCNRQSRGWSAQVLGSDFRVRTQQAAMRPLILSLLRTAPLVFCPGLALKRDMVAVGIPGDKIIPFNNGIDAAVFFPAGKTCMTNIQPRKTVLFVGNLVTVKRVDRLLLAWACRQQNHGGNAEVAAARLVIVGEGVLRPRLESMAKALGIASSVQFAGLVPHHEIADWLRSSHCLCLTSQSEGMPNVVLEAFGCGIPVVATAVGEVPHLIHEDINGYAIPNDTLPKPTLDSPLVTALAKALVKTLTREWSAPLIADTVKEYRWDEAAKTITAAINRNSR